MIRQSHQLLWLAAALSWDCSQAAAVRQTNLIANPLV